MHFLSFIYIYIHIIRKNDLVTEFIFVLHNTSIVLIIDENRFDLISMLDSFISLG